MCTSVNDNLSSGAVWRCTFSLLTSHQGDVCNVWPRQRERNLRLRGRLDLLLGENEALHMKVADLKVWMSNDTVAADRLPDEYRQSAAALMQCL
jgi:hypothetical protein